VKEAFISFGSNWGERVFFCKRALSLLKEAGEILKVSSLWLSEPWGYREQPFFINGVLKLKTPFSARELLEFLKKTEKEVGRRDRFRWGPREIDLDLLLYGEEVIDEKDLKVPHPFLHQRAFVLVPLVEIEPEAYHPIFKKTARELLKLLESPEKVIYYGRIEDAP
jgi:2-amino-4-hydroxy-6-hydroxymethyldihydropteridine diphosphokinase